MYIRRSWSVLLSHLAVRYPDVKCRRTEFRRWNVGAWNSECEMSANARLSGSTPFEFPQEDMWRAPLFELPQGEAHDTREHHTRTIAYPIRICCPDGKHWLASKPCYFIPKACHSPRSAALRWCVRMPCSDIFYHGFQRTLFNLGLLWWLKSYQNTKT